ncbi:MAG TPA: DNA methyltransferase [Candidatus Nanoarchaeia archaeon]|nr:DNA methyltransferase [Candidatus Nanoarchaeia archaeon]
MEINAIYEGDNIEILSKFPDNSVDLIYADPPFYTNKGFEIIWKDSAEIRAFQDRWKGGIEHYIAWMEPRLRECHRLLKDHGSMFLHCDFHANAHLRVVMDKIFGEGNFVNEIIWQRTHAHGGGGRGFSRVHDVILFYSKSKKFTFNRQHLPYSQEYIENFFRYQDKKGKYRLVVAHGAGETKSDYLWKGMKSPKGRHWAYTRENMEKLAKQGKIQYSATGMPYIKQYIGDKEGTLIIDVWTDIEVIHSQSKERLGYPTQKPVALLERIIKAGSNENNVVFDPFCGCGTTLVAAQRLKRKWVGIDISRTACKLMVKRMRGEFSTTPQVIRGTVDINYVKKLQPFDFQNWVVVDKFLGIVSKTKSGDLGVDGFTPQITGGYPIQVKQSSDVGRNVIDNFETAMRRLNKKKGYVVAFSFGKGSYEEAARAKNQEGLHIVLRTVQDLLEGRIEE